MILLVPFTSLSFLFSLTFLINSSFCLFALCLLGVQSCFIMSSFFHMSSTMVHFSGHHQLLQEKNLREECFLRSPVHRLILSAQFLIFIKECPSPLLLLPRCPSHCVMFLKHLGSFGIVISNDGLWFTVSTGYDFG